MSNYDWKSYPEQRQYLLEALRDVAEMLRPVERVFVPVAQYRKMLKARIQFETWGEHYPNHAAPGFWAGREARRPLWRELGENEQAHCRESGTGVVVDYKEITAIIRRYQRELEFLERAINRQRNKPLPPAAKAGKHLPDHSQLALFEADNEP